MATPFNLQAIYDQLAPALPPKVQDRCCYFRLEVHLNQGQPRHYLTLLDKAHTPFHQVAIDALMRV